MYKDRIKAHEPRRPVVRSHNTNQIEINGDPNNSDGDRTNVIDKKSVTMTNLRGSRLYSEVAQNQLSDYIKDLKEIMMKIVQQNTEILSLLTKLVNKLSK